MPAKFRKKPIVIRAAQWNGKTLQDAIQLIRELGADEIPSLKQNGSLLIDTLEGEMECRKGDWLIKGVQGELYPCKPDIFEATYELVLGVGDE